MQNFVSLMLICIRLGKYFLSMTSTVVLNENTKPNCFFPGQPQVIGPLQPLVAVVGDDIILPCHLEPAIDAGSMAVEWMKLDVKPRFVHVWHAGQKLELDHQNPTYRGRTSLFSSKLKRGDISLKLSKVRLSDRGKYKCYIPTLNTASVSELVVGKWAFVQI